MIGTVNPKRILLPTFMFFSFIIQPLTHPESWRELCSCPAMLAACQAWQALNSVGKWVDLFPAAFTPYCGSGDYSVVAVTPG
jgi:hypothetical protein